MRALAILFILSSLITLPGTLNAAAGPSFPSEKEEIRDPTGQYAIAWKASKGGESPHHLFMKDMATGRKSKLFAFHRSVNVLWASDGRFVAVTDWTGSNSSKVLLFDPHKKGAVLNLPDKLFRSLGKQPEIAGNDHVYFEALCWDGPEKLIFKVFGHGDHDRKGFEKYFEFEMPAKVVRKIDHAQASCGPKPD